MSPTRGQSTRRRSCARFLIGLLASGWIGVAAFPASGIDFASHEFDLGYLRSAWASPPEPPTLAALRKLRLRDLPDHPLAEWVADRLARDAGKTPERADVEAALLSFQRQGHFWVRDDASGLWLSNGIVGLSLFPAKQGAAVASLYNLQTGTECLFKRPTASTPWRVTVLKRWPKGTPAPIQLVFPNLGQDLSCLKEVDGGALEAAWKLEPSFLGNEMRLAVHWRPLEVSKGGDQFAVTATIVMEKDSPLIRWRAEVNRVSGAEYTLIALQFPVLRSLTASGESDFFNAWGGRGRGHLNRACKGWGNPYLTYPHGGWTLQFVTVSFGPGSTLYLACHDGEGNLKQLTFHPGDETYISHVAWSPDELKMPYDVVLGPIHGDWYDAARMYRRWALKQPWCAKGPLAERVKRGTIARRMLETDLWIRPNWLDSGYWRTGVDQVRAETDWFWKAIPPASMTNNPGWKTVLATNAALVPSLVSRKPALGVWWYAWAKQPFDAETPSFDARPGVKEEFTEETKLGLTAMPYVQCQAWDMEQPSYDDAAKAAACKQIDGTPLVARFNPGHPLAYLCPSQAPMQEKVSQLAAYVHKLGANAIYLDTFPPGEHCWDPSHGHTLGPGGHWSIPFIHAMLERIKREQGQQFGVMTESSSEVLMDVLDLQMSWWYIEPEDAPLWPAIYGGYTVISGTQTHGEGATADDQIAFRLKTGRPMIWGSQLGRAMWSEYLQDGRKCEFLARLLGVKAQMHKFLTYGEMLRPPALLGAVPRVHTDQWVVGTAKFKFDYDAYEAALWRAPDGELGLAIVNFDDRPHDVRFAAKDVFPRGTRRASLVNCEGAKDWRRVEASEEPTIAVPAADALVIVFQK